MRSQGFLIILRDFLRITQVIEEFRVLADAIARS